jgi:hypothetical protein
MQRVVLFLSILIFSINTFAQKDKNQYTDISPDGKLISTYRVDELNPSGIVEKLTDDIPFGLTPDWSSTLDRQIGGMAWADYDNDGDLDLATGCYFSQSFPPIPEHEVLIYRNDNGMLTTTPAWVSSDMRSTTDVKFGDLNNDGKPELLAANGDQSFVPSVIYFNGPNGLDTVPGWISQDNNWTVGAAFSDINGDGYLDLAFGNQGNSVTPTKPLSIFYNDNTGNLPTIPNWLSADVMLASTVAFGDMDNQQLTVQVMHFTGDGIRYAFPLNMIPIYSIDSVYIDQQPYYQYCYDPTSGWVSLGNKPPAGSSVKVVYKFISMGDLAVSKWINYQSAVYFNNGGTINNLPGWTVGHSQGQKGTAFADFDKDGFMDLAISGSSVQTVVYKNNNGALTGPVWTSNSPNTSAQELIAGDLDRDGYPELAVVHFGSSRVEIFKNRNGVLDSTATWLYIAGTSATSISFGDLNGDGSLDLAVGTARSPVVVFLNTSPPVPVELKSFTAVAGNKQIELSWSTSTELNNRGFEIERRRSDGNFKYIGFVEGNGTTTEQNNYSYTDKNLSDGKYSYRLKQIDFDVSYEYSNVIETELKSLDAYLLEQNYPNPFNPATKISWQLPFDGRQTLKIYDVLGNEVAVLTDEYKAAGFYEVIFDASQLSSGIYLYVLTTDGFVQSKKMLLLK